MRPLFAFPSGGGADLDGVTLTVLNMGDGSWTISDLDTIVDTVNTVSGITTFTMNALASSSADYNIARGSNIRGWRAYKLLQDSAGNQITTEDNCLLRVRITPQAQTNPFDDELVVGLCEDPTSTVAATIKLVGAISRHNRGILHMGSFSQNGSWTSRTGAVAAVDVTIMVNGGRYGQVHAMTLDSSGNALADPDRSGLVPTPTTNLYLAVFLGRFTTGVDANDDAGYRIETQLIKFA